MVMTVTQMFTLILALDVMLVSFLAITLFQTWIYLAAFFDLNYVITPSCDYVPYTLYYSSN